MAKQTANQVRITPTDETETAHVVSVHDQEKGRIGIIASGEHLFTYGKDGSRAYLFASIEDAAAAIRTNATAVRLGQPLADLEPYTTGDDSAPATDSAPAQEDAPTTDAAAAEPAAAEAPKAKRARKAKAVAAPVAAAPKGKGKAAQAERAPKQPVPDAGEWPIEIGSPCTIYRAGRFYGRSGQVIGNPISDGRRPVRLDDGDVRLVGDKKIVTTGPATPVEKPVRNRSAAAGERRTALRAQRAVALPDAIAYVKAADSETLDALLLEIEARRAELASAPAQDDAPTTQQDGGEPGKCARCGESLSGETAEVAGEDGAHIVVHQGCMLDGEQVA